MKKRIIATSTEVGVQVNRGEKTKNLKYAKSAKYPLELVKVILWIYIDTVDDDTDMKMVSGHIAGSTNLGNGVVLVHRITNLCQKLAAMGVKGAIPAAVVDDEIISITDMVAGLYDRTGFHCQNWCAVGIGNV